MPNASCSRCGKTAYPLESLTALGTVFHKGCFKCVVCNMSLNLKNFKGFEGKIYCVVHTPNVKATAVADDSHVTQALNAPKRNTTEGARGVQKGTGDKANFGIDSLATKNAMNAPKAKSEGLGNVQKGTGDRTNYGVESLHLQSALNAPKAKAEGLGNVQKGTGEAPAAAPVFGAELGGAPAPAPAQHSAPAHHEPAQEQHSGYEEQQGGYEEQQGGYEEGYAEGGYEEGYYEEGYAEGGYEEGYEGYEEQ